MTPKPKPSPQRVRELLRYDRGAVYWRTPTNRQKQDALGAPAGHGGRLQTPIEGRATYVHHLVWVLHHGEWPTTQVDHVNGNKLDNRIENLRLATNAENCQNRHHSGVSYDHRKAQRHWRARIMVHGRSISLGYYATRDQAEAEYRRAKLVYHQPFASGVGAAA